MRVVIDIEANSLVNPTNIWVIVCKDIDSGVLEIFREVTLNETEKQRFLAYASKVDRWIGHNYLGWDYPVLMRLVGLSVPEVAAKTYDTLILSKLIDYPRKGHSIESYGEEFGLEKIKFNDFTKYSQQMEDYCVRDVEICHLVYRKYLKYISDQDHKPSILLEHQFQLVVNDLHNNGFSFNTARANGLLEKVTKELAALDKDIEDAFPPRLALIREITPKLTKHGTLSRTDFRWVNGGDLSEYNGGPFCRCGLAKFNASSHKQVIQILSEARWDPSDKTETHKDVEREVNRLKHSKKTTEVDLRLESLYNKLQLLQKYGYKINELNLSTLPDTAPSPARLLAKRILLESRRRTLTEWLGLVTPQGRIHGHFQGIGAWTHRMAHQKPNTANIPNEFDTQGNVKLLGKEMRQLWQAPARRLLVGVDAEGIQLRIFAHYIDDPEFTRALVEGKKSDGSDPHSLNKRILGSACKTRTAAKRFIYALLLGAGIGKLDQVLDCSREETESALANLMQRYQGFTELKKERIPADAKRGWFRGIDGRRVKIPGDTESQRRHLCMSGYLQNGEAIVMKKATLLWYNQLEGTDLLVDMVHDEWQTETKNSMEKALRVAEIQSRALWQVGQDLKLKCPLAGSYYNDDHQDYTIGTNWYQTH